MYGDEGNGDFPTLGPFVLTIKYFWYGLVKLPPQISKVGYSYY